MNIENIDIRKTFAEVLPNSRYCHTLLMAIEEEKRGRPLPVVPEDNMAFMMWHTQGLIAFTEVPYIAEGSISVTTLMPFVKLPAPVQQRILYRASILTLWLYDGLMKPITLYYVEE